MEVRHSGRERNDGRLVTQIAGFPRPIHRKRKEHLMSEAVSHEAPVLTEEQIDGVLQQFADGFGRQLRSPVYHWPEEAGLDYEEVSFPSRDGTPLDGWFIPAPGSDKLIIANHPMGYSRSGQPSQFEPWRSLWASSGNTFEVNFIPDYRILHDAGYNVLTYDLRNHGLSGAANGGFSTSGLFEARDVVGSIRYARSREDTKDMTIGLFSRCLGCNSTFAAMTQFPEEFEGIRCLVAPMPVTTHIIVAHQLGLEGVPDERIPSAIEDLDHRIRLQTGIGFDRRNNREWAKNVMAPTFLYQVRDDVLTDPSDVRTMHDNIPLAEKKLRWIEGTTYRWDGYLEFQRRPEPMLEWFERYMS